MTDTQLSTSVIIPQEQQLLMLTQGHHVPVQKQSLQQRQQHQQNLYYHHHHSQDQQEQHLDDTTQDFFIQDMPDNSAGIIQGPPTLLQLQHTTTSIPLEEELNIYDYIHAKQEDEDEHDSQDQGHTHAHERDPLSDSLSSSMAVVEDNISPRHHTTVRQSPATSPSISSPVLSAQSSSSPLLSALSPSSPCSESRAELQDDYSVAATVNDGQTEQDTAFHETTHIKQESLESTSLLAHHTGYMDTSMELYGSTDPSLMSSQASLMSPPPQDLFRVLMEDFQAQAAIQREKFYSATTGSGTGMDSVEFLFNGLQSQDRVQTPTVSTTTMPTSLSSQTQMKSTSDYLADVNGVHPEMSSSNASVEQDSSYSGTRSTSSPINMDDLSPPSVNTRASLSANELEADISLSPAFTNSSSLSSGSATPVLTSSFSHSSKTSSYSSAPRAAVVGVAFTRIASQHSKTNNRASKASDSMNIDDSQISMVSPTSQHSLRTTTEQQTRGRTAEVFKEEEDDQWPGSNVITMQPAPRKKRKMNRNAETQSQEGSPRLNALPSPPSSVRTTPPLQPMAVDGCPTIDNLILPDVCSSQNEPVTPTSPLMIKIEADMEPISTANLSSTSGTVTVTDRVAETISLAESAEVEVGKKSSPTNGGSKRPWTVEEEKLLLKLVDDKAPIKDIAETLNRSVHSVRSRRQVLTDPGFVKGNGHAQPRRSKPDPASKLPTYSQMAFLSLARLPELQGTLNDVASMVEKLFSRHLNRIPRTGHKNLQIWRAQISDALAHEKGHPRPRFESFGVKRGRQWVYRLTDFGKGVMKAMGCVDQICEDLLKNNELAYGEAARGPDGESIGTGGADAGLGQGNGYGYSYCPETTYSNNNTRVTNGVASAGSKFSSSPSTSSSPKEMSAKSLAVSNAIANAMAAMAAGLAAMTAAEDEKSAAAAAAASAVTIAGADITMTASEASATASGSSKRTGLVETSSATKPKASASTTFNTAVISGATRGRAKA
ncbi:hypothetical protein BX616_007200 [Lobosporangium transversale]|uniref:Uncharacterized protein n=1 Tax=Lobosporangium transversale TaxID=64571 RepID=A0A1Y2GIV8_9FUNG|nr:hypothetical protein BCR41DRAFT_104417 [Lobosporangium transversale]KAF9914960.1 hypothetical protein BX616_007200 [Lobosporangium transversale]ORZ12091.1 hypothetical protein BCR41DRAFT_104417 [Lobosporangium transversale]|eukprot:XP_021879956.1 hypothetical protein BCR41DRAFT_104417 [Lobosporangium transversale]